MVAARVATATVRSPEAGYSVGRERHRCRWRRVSDPQVVVTGQVSPDHDESLGFAGRHVNGAALGGAGEVRSTGVKAGGRRLTEADVKVRVAGRATPGHVRLEQRAGGDRERSVGLLLAHPHRLALEALR